MPKTPGNSDQDETAREVDRLLRQLPGADPTLSTDPDQPPPRPQSVTRSPMGPRPPMPPPRPAGPTTLQRVGVWSQVVGGALLGGALTQWPYANDCGWPLYGYLAAVFALLLTAGWAAVSAWGIRSAAAHTLALVVGFWGVVLAAEQILPRVGYAAEQRWWACSAIPVAAPSVPRPPVVPAAVPDSAAPGDSVSGAPPPADSGAGVPPG